MPPIFASRLRKVLQLSEPEGELPFVEFKGLNKKIEHAKLPRLLEDLYSYLEDKRPMEVFDLLPPSFQLDENAMSLTRVTVDSVPLV